MYGSVLLPRGQTNVKPFSDILKILFESREIDYIDNHDSFVIAPSKLPSEFLYPDKINLNFLGTRALVHNINNHCTVLLPTRGDSRQELHFGQSLNRFFCNRNQGRNRRQVQTH